MLKYVFTDHFIHCNENKSFWSLRFHDWNSDLSFASPWGPLPCSVALEAVWMPGFWRARALDGWGVTARILLRRPSESCASSESSLLYLQSFINKEFSICFNSDPTLFQWGPLCSSHLMKGMGRENENDKRSPGHNLKRRKPTVCPRLS